MVRVAQDAGAGAEDFGAIGELGVFQAQVVAGDRLDVFGEGPAGGVEQVVGAGARVRRRG